MIEGIIQILAQILAPLSLGILTTAIIAGIVLGLFYNYPLNIDPDVVFHKMVAGWSFIVFIFVYRIVTSIVTGIAGPSPLGWVGIAILWGVYCGSIWATERTIRWFKDKKR
jgi:hypothetical protein